MSNPNEPSDASKPVIKDKNPHNYRKVGYSMIVISVSLVLIGLLVWAIGDNYHFSSDIMANQEIDAMTPKHGFNLVYYDTQQPVGAKLKLLDSASTIDDAQQKQIQYAQQNPSPLGKVLIFNQTLVANKQQVSSTIAAITQYQADLAKAQAAKAQAQTSAPIVSPATSAAPTSKNITASNTTKTVITSPPTIIVPTNSTITHPVSNATISSAPASVPENIPIGANVTASNSAKVVTSNATTSNHTKTLVLSENLGIKSK